MRASALAGCAVVVIWRCLVRKCDLHVEAEKHHVAILYNVFLPLGAHESLVPRLLQAAAGEEIVQAHGLGPDEAALEVGVNDSRRLRGGVAPMNRPGADFLLARGEV